jgi:hypothetical protein
MQPMFGPPQHGHQGVFYLPEMQMARPQADRTPDAANADWRSTSLSVLEASRTARRRAELDACDGNDQRTSYRLFDVGGILMIR